MHRKAILTGSSVAVVMTVAVVLILLWVPLATHRYWFETHISSNCPEPALNCSASTGPYRSYSTGQRISFSWWVNTSGATGTVGLFSPSGQSLYSGSGSSGSGSYQVEASGAGTYEWNVAISGPARNASLTLYGNVTWSEPLL
jgi:hypothetical protein